MNNIDKMNDGIHTITEIREQVLKPRLSVRAVVEPLVEAEFLWLTQEEVFRQLS